MARTALLILLVLALLIELVLAVGGFVAPDVLLARFGLGNAPDTQFMGYALVWLLFGSLADALLLVWAWQRHPGNPALCYVLGFWVDRHQLGAVRHLWPVRQLTPQLGRGLAAGVGYPGQPPPTAYSRSFRPSPSARGNETGLISFGKA